MKSLKIALTGGIACGKSQFADFLVELGVEVIRLDDLSKQVTATSDVLKELVDAFGEDILKKNGSLNRKVLRTILLESKSNQTLIEDILHPKILKKMQELQEKSEKSLTIVEIPLFFEKKLEYLFDRVIIITCNDKKQLKKLQKRTNIDEKSAKQMVSIQISQKNRLIAAEQMQNDIIDNNGSIEDLEQCAKQLYKKLVNL